MKVYFNNSCKICRAEINLYKKQNIKDIEWVDITNNKSAEIETQRNAKNLLRRLHIKDGEKVIGGAEAFLLVWKKIPKYKFLYSFFKTPIIFTLFSLFYEIIAFFLFLKYSLSFCSSSFVKAPNPPIKSTFKNSVFFLIQFLFKVFTYKF